ncbi:hypothetical protein BG003_011183 [Podila horticola]|nr:hypothetical protein BG003_011183 [Podila horticola]
MTDTPVVEAVAAPVEITPAAEAPAETPIVEAKADKTAQKAQILKQVEFYFSDSNLPSDKFMSELVSKNKEGYVSIAKISSFKRMREFTDKDLIVEALRESPELLQVSEDGLTVRRKSAVVPTKDHFQRSIYAKGFGEETPSLQLELEEYFSQYGDIKQVRMRRNNETSAFKGSVFVEYATLDEANKVASSKLQYKDQDLLVMSKQAYCEMKAKELGLDPSEIRARPQNKGFNNNKDKKEKRPREEEKVETVEDMKNKVIRLTGLISGEGAGLKEIKDAMKEHFRYGYVKWPRESDVAEIQIKSDDKDAAKVVADLQEAGFTFNGAKPEISAASDEQVQAFFEDKKTWEANMSSRESNRGGRGGRGGRGRGGRGRGRGGNDRKKIRTD